MKQPVVQIRSVESYNLPQIEDAVSTWFKDLKDPKFARSKRVLIKPNLLGAFPLERAVTTHPIVLEALIRYFLARKKEVWVGDSPGGSVPVPRVWDVCGIQDLADRYPIRLINLSTHPLKEMKYNGISVKISEALYKCGIVINVAKYKTHSLMAYTGALKNLYGLVPGMVKSEYHRQYPDTVSFAELLLAVYGIAKSKISYNIIDGIIGMDGAGPSGGTPRNFGLLMGSDSIAALDAVAARMMGFSVSDVPYLWDALHLEGILPSQIIVPHSFKHHHLAADIQGVKISKESLRYLPRFMAHTFRKVYYYHPQISERCVRCGICVKSCPVEAISWQENGFPKVNKDKCIKCMCCHEMCPSKAIDIHKSFVARMVTR
ncbi:MAG: DUF362 domain-containing protein [Candidatus Cloacimonetes bacterium]|nr:DUF362 domain-containing protein [Candidatus Cloacimonadota bacterium]MDD4806721.1 DUF362 domain-containing protein [Candidatus Cloacimonadota bacterium]